jgi:regulator of replication initiation timing
MTDKIDNSISDTSNKDDVINNIANITKINHINDFPFVEENKHVKELADILTKNGLGDDAKGIVEVFNHICKVEQDLGTALGELTALRIELSAMREEQKHPVKTMLHKAVDDLMSKVKALFQQIISLKDKFVKGCRRAVEDIKDKGITVANGIVSALGVKSELEASKTRINNLINNYEKRIDKISVTAQQYPHLTP